MEGKLTVNFFGICTFMTHRIQQDIGMPFSESIAWGNRYVLVDGRDAVIHNTRGLHGHDIAPHRAEMQILVDDIVTATNMQTAGFDSVKPPISRLPDGRAIVAWRLHEVLLSVANAIPFSPTTIAEPETGGIPHLFPEVPPGGTFPRPSMAMTLNTIPTRAAAYFDFFSGDLNPVGTPGGAVVGQLVVRTIGHPQIRVNPFDGRGATLNIELRSDAEVAVSNLPEKGAPDTDADFRLHYLTCELFPDHVHIPAVVPDLPLIRTRNPPRAATDLLLTVGCSNSQYP